MVLPPKAQDCQTSTKFYPCRNISEGQRVNHIRIIKNEKASQAEFSWSLQNIGHHPEKILSLTPLFDEGY
jgi:hypothetical protein